MGFQCGLLAFGFRRGFFRLCLLFGDPRSLFLPGFVFRLRGVPPGLSFGLFLCAGLFARLQLFRFFAGDFGPPGVLRGPRLFGGRALGFDLGLFLGRFLRLGLLARLQLGSFCRLAFRAGFSLGHRRFRRRHLYGRGPGIRMEGIDPSFAPVLRSLQGITRIHDDEEPTRSMVDRSCKVIGFADFQSLELAIQLIRHPSGSERLQFHGTTRRIP